MAGKDAAKTVLYVAVAAGAAYLLYKLWSTVSGAAKAVIGAPAAVGEAIGSGLYDLFNPGGGMGQTVFKTATFPDGTRHAIAAGIINNDGTVTIPANDSSGTYVTPAVSQTYGGTTYQLVVSKQDGSTYAMPTS